MTAKKDNMDWAEVMALRSAYNNGLKTPETREACRIYINVMRKRRAQELKERCYDQQIGKNGI